MWSVWLFIAGALHSVVGRSSPCGIIEGNPIDIHHVPYMVSLRSDKGHFCGGSIVDKQFILTAAHCCNAGHEIVAVVVGSTRLDEIGDEYTVDKIFFHPNYSTDNFENDAALIHVSKPIVFTKSVKRIKLTKRNKKFKRGAMLTASGWGQTEFGDISNNLLTVKLPFVDTTTCQKEYLGMGINITNRMMCAGEEGQDTCHGDSGGPLVYRDEQVGITSFGMECGRGPGVYTRVSSIVGWIYETICQNKL